MNPLTQRQQPDLNEVCRLGLPPSVVGDHAKNAPHGAPGEWLHHLLEEACIRFATNDVVIESGSVLSYRDLNCRSNHLARHLLARGIKSGDCVAMLFDKSPETFEQNSREVAKAAQDVNSRFNISFNNNNTNTTTGTTTSVA
ncbi:MAG: AMP-binding protein [Thermoproteota archaeon]|nr:AMP-binding protein [Thermoproteota archaeon]